MPEKQRNFSDKEDHVLGETGGWNGKLSGSVPTVLEESIGRKLVILPLVPGVGFF